MAGYRYALLGLVGLVALVAIVAILKTYAPDISLTGSLTGRAVTDTGPIAASPPTTAPPVAEPPTQVSMDISLKEGETKDITLDGIDDELYGFAVAAPDWTGKPSAIIRVNGLVTSRLYPGASYVIVTGEHILVTLSDVKDGTADITLTPTTKSPPPAPVYNGIADNLADGETKTYTLGGLDYEVTAHFFEAGTRPSIAFAINGIGSPQLQPGNSYAAKDVTVTLNDLFVKSNGQAMAFFVLAPASCGPIDQQTLTCRGTSACCGGTCTGLVSCTNMRDGPAPSCGARNMYCCGGKLSFQSCGCDYNGQHYDIGQSYPAGDSCNHCTCGPKGPICTEMACPQPASCNSDADCSSNQMCEQLPCVEQPPQSTTAASPPSTGSPSTPPSAYTCGGRCVTKPTITACNGSTNMSDFNGGSITVSKSDGSVTEFSDFCGINSVGFYGAQHYICGVAEGAPSYWMITKDCNATGQICVKGQCLANTTVTCPLNGITYKAGDSFPAGDGCNTCSCGPKGAICTTMACPAPKNCSTDADCTPTEMCEQLPCVDGVDCPSYCAPRPCLYNGKQIPAGGSVPAADGCNSCSCTSSGSVVCTTKACPAVTA